MKKILENIRNFSIIAHIDHGKSTLSDRIIEFCGGLDARDMKEQVLDSIDIERERGITIKSQTVRLNYRSRNGMQYIFNLMDTPGHVDFSYEVSRCLAACEGSILLVDSTQGVEAQTVANAYKAIDNDNVIIPVLNKSDLPASEPERVKSQIFDIIGINADNALLVSGKTGDGINDLLELIIEKIPAPVTNDDKLKALLIDAWYDNYLGVVLLVRVINGSIKKGSKIRMIHYNISKIVEHIGYFTPKKTPVNEIKSGEVGYIVANIKNIHECYIGDTIIDSNDTESIPLPGFHKVNPVVFCGVYPVDKDDYLKLKESLERFSLNDSSISYEAESSSALGLGFRCGFLGLLHMEVVYERLMNEYDLNIITTFPSVIYKIYHNDGNMKEIHNSADFPDPVYIDRIEEPIANVDILTTNEYVGDIITLCLEKRGIQKNLSFSGENRALLTYHIPVGEIIFDFHDRLKSISKGYASAEWNIVKYEESDIIKVSILINNEPIDALSLILHRSKSEFRGRALCARLKDLIPRQQIPIPIQAAIGGKIIARETIKPFRKDVTAKLYGGDVTRRMKLLEKQKKGKKKMKSFGKVDIPQDVFINALKENN